jgi:hypothetical protein
VTSRVSACCSEGCEESMRLLSKPRFRSALGA